MNLRISFCFVSLSGLIFSLLPVNLTRVSAQNIPQPPPITLQQIEQLRARAKAVRRVNLMLRQRQVPFDPYHLFAKNWRNRLRAGLSQMPEMQISRVLESGDLEGVEIANELSLPEQIRLTGDTVILAKRIRFRGQNIRIKGPHAVHFFAVDSLGTRDGGGTITIDTSGPGRREWLESRNPPQSSVQRQVEKPKTIFQKTSYVFSEPFTQNQNGQPGADGANGQNGSNGSNGSAGSNGTDGSCKGNRNGSNGQNGSDGSSGFNGGNANNGGNGGAGQPITITVTDMNATYNLITKGGAGGNGGAGGYGGNGGIGGHGGNGGNGAGCACNDLGMGGNGGNGGNGGSAGDAGVGGNGGNGGLGGQITLNYPEGYNLNQITYNVDGGPAGSPGQGGIPGQLGLQGERGTGGAGGSVFSCSSNTGQNGTGGSPGIAGGGGGGGAGGSGGDPGNITFNPMGGGGGGGVGGTLEPGGYNGYCTNWYWVYYSCYWEQTARLTPDSLKYLSSLKRDRNETNVFQPISLKTSVSTSECSLFAPWECYVTDVQWAGCW